MHWDASPTSSHIDHYLQSQINPNNPPLVGNNGSSDEDAKITEAYEVNDLNVFKVDEITNFSDK